MQGALRFPEIPDDVGSHCHRRDRKLATPRLAVLEHSPGGRAAPPPEPIPEPERFVTLGFVRRGLVSLDFETFSVPVDVNQVVVIPPGLPYLPRHVICGGKDCAITIHMSRGEYRRFFAGPIPERPRLLPRPPRFNLELASLMARKSDPNDGSDQDEPPFDDFLGAFGERCQELGADLPEEAPWPSPPVQRTIEVLARDKTEPIQLDSLARAVNCSKFHLCRLFKRETGSTLTQYLHRLRINEAMEFLADGEEDLSRLAFDLGFSSHSHFTSVFRRELGVPPSEARALCQGPTEVPEADRARS